MLMSGNDLFFSQGLWITSLVNDFVLIEQFIQFLFASSAQAKHHIVTTKSRKALGEHISPPRRHLEREV